MKGQAYVAVTVALVGNLRLYRLTTGFRSPDIRCSEAMSESIHGLVLILTLI